MTMPTVINTGPPKGLGSPAILSIHNHGDQFRATLVEPHSSSVSFKAIKKTHSHAEVKYIFIYIDIFIFCILIGNFIDRITQSFNMLNIFPPPRQTRGSFG